MSPAPHAKPAPASGAATANAATTAATTAEAETETETEAASLQPLLAEALRLALAHAPVDGQHATAVPGLQLIRASAPAQPLPAVYEPGLVVVLQGRKQAWLGDQVLHYDPLHCLLVSVKMLPSGQITEASPTAPYLCLRLSLDAQALAGLLLALGPPPPRPPAAAVPPLNRGLNVARVSPALLDAVLRLLRLLDTPQHLPVLAPLAQREILYRVLISALGAPLRALAVAEGQAQRIARAIDLLARRFAEPVRVHELAAAAHMSPSSLHQHFKQVTALSPLQYQKQLRLHRARQLMLSQGLDAATAAHQVGYESASQFSREYRRLFGAPPATEQGRLRGTAASTSASG